MAYLAIVSLVWAFSFGLIGGRLAGLDASFVALLRLTMALLCFLPFLRLGRATGKERAQLVGLGALQFGLMYVAYIRAFAFLPSHLIALFSVLTPLYIALAYALAQRRFRWQLLACALLSIAGAAVIKFARPDGSYWTGIVLMQVSNIAFGLGQLIYRSWRRARPSVRDHEIFAWLYAGGALFAGLAFAVFGDFARAHPTREQWVVIAYLGVVASGLGFFLWNKGAAQTAPGALAAFNNAVVPLAMLLSLFYFGEAKTVAADSVIKLALGGGLIAAAIWWGSRPSVAR